MELKDLLSYLTDKKLNYSYLLPGSPVMIRHKNILQPLDMNILKPADIDSFIVQMTSEKQRELLNNNKEIDFTYSVPGLSRFRINIYTQRGSKGLVIQINPFKIPTFEELSLPDSLKKNIIDIKNGLIAITGPKGSGKSHTLAAIINYIIENKSVNIVTLENPIKFLFKNKKGIISQREIGTDTLSYTNAFNSLNYQAPDVLIVTEVSSFEVLYQILKLASSGMLVIITSLSPGVHFLLEQIIDLFPPNLQQQARNFLSISIQTVISQTLCIGSSNEEFIPVFDILYGTSAVKSAIKENRINQLQAIMGSTGREAGMMTQEQSLRALVKKGAITIEEANLKAIRIEEFKKIMSLPY